MEANMQLICKEEENKANQAGRASLRKLEGL